MPKPIDVNLLNLLDHLNNTSSPGIKYAVSDEQLEEISNYPGGSVKAGLEHFLKHGEGRYLASRFPTAFEELGKFAEGHTEEINHQEGNDNKDNQKEDHDKTKHREPHGGSQEHYTPNEEQQSQQQVVVEEVVSPTPSVEMPDIEEPSDMGDDFDGDVGEDTDEEDATGEDTTSGGEGGEDNDESDDSQNRDSGGSNQLQNANDMEGKAEDLLNGGNPTEAAETGAGTEGAATGAGETATTGAGTGAGATGASATEASAASAGATAAGAGGTAAVGTAAPAAVGTGGGVIAGLVAALPIIGIVAIIVVILLAIVLLLVYVLWGYGGNQIFPYVQVSCGEVIDYPPLLTGDNFDSSVKTLLTKHYGLTYNGTTYNGVSVTQNTKTSTPTPNGTPVMTFVKKDLPTLINTTCLLFGHVNAQVTNNTFGKLVTGAGGNSPYPVNISLAYDDSSPCGYKILSPNQKAIYINYINPNKCASDYQFEFYIGQSLGEALLMQQQHLKGSQSILQTFTNSDFFLQNGAENSLPTNGCETTFGTPNYFPNCFADMVGEYYTYPYYLDAPPINYIPSTTCESAGGYCSQITTPNSGYVGSAAYTCSETNPEHPYYCYIPLAKGTPSPPPSATLTDFPTGQYRGYYLFAKNNLFDGIELFMQQQNGAPECPNPLTTSDPASIKKIIHDNYGFNVQADASVNNAKVLGIVYDTLCKLNLSQKFASLVGNMNPDGSIKQTLTFSIHSGECGTGNEYNYPNIDVNYCSTSDDAFRFVITHELGHVILQNNPSVKDDFINTLFQPSATTVSSGHGRLTASSNRQLPTDNCQCATPALSSSQCGGGTFGSHPANECFADMIGEYLVFQTYEHSQTTRNSSVTFSQYPTMYASWYDFARDKIFGGLEYINKGSNGNLAQVGINLAQDIISSCPKLSPTIAVVNKSDINCLNMGKYSSQVINELTSSVNDTGTLQCVGFVRAYAQAIQIPLIKPVDLGRKSNDAYQYAGTNQPGYTWYSQADLKSKHMGVQPGDIAVFGNHLNHIGVVSSIVGDGTQRFGLAEANGATGSVDITSPGNYLFDDNFLGVFRVQ